jgi:hypothetical protein
VHVPTAVVVDIDEDRPRATRGGERGAERGRITCATLRVVAQRDPDETSGWYEDWLRDTAGGKHVPTLPLFLLWVGVVAVVAAVVYLAGGRSEPDYVAPIGIVSGLYWFVGVPVYVHRRYRDR